MLGNKEYLNVSLLFNHKHNHRMNTEHPALCAILNDHAFNFKLLMNDFLLN